MVNIQWGEKKKRSEYKVSFRCSHGTRMRKKFEIVCQKIISSFRASRGGRECEFERRVSEKERRKNNGNLVGI